MLGFLIGWWRARAARPILWWVIALLLYALLPLPEQLVLFLVIGLGVALTVTVRRLRESGQDSADRAWSIAERLTDALEDRIRQPEPPPQVQPSYGYAEPVRPQLTPMAAAYDPGMLLSVVVAVLNAEGLAVNAGPALPACAQLLSWQGIATVPGAPAPTAHALATGLGPGAPRRYRAVPPAVLATCIAAVLVADGVLPLQLHSDDAAALIDATAVILEALNIAPDPGAGTVNQWPVMAEIINTAPGIR